MHSGRPDEVEFFLRPFRVTADVLMPRLETESLVRRAVAELRRERADTVIDVGTGSGVIVVSIAASVAGPRFLGLDVSENALVLACENARRNAVPVEFLRSDLLSALEPKDFSWKFLFFAANLPYIREDDPDVGEDVARLDPALALYGGKETGFECTERFLRESLDFARIAASCRIVLEFGHDQLETARRASESLGYRFDPFADLSSVPRFALLTYEPRSREVRE